MKPPAKIKPTNLSEPAADPASFVGSGLGRALTGISSKGLRAAQSGGKNPGAFKPSKKGPAV